MLPRRLPSELWWAAVLLMAPQAWAAVPPPAQTPARVIVSGRTSTAVDIVIVKVGQEVPPTFGDKTVGNTLGYEWYVSEHYALKSQMDEGFSRMILELSELSLPHWEAMTGLKAPKSDTARMCIVYAKSAPEVVKAIEGDLGFTWTVNGGGVTWWGAWAAYDYPSGSLQYHLRDIAIHENLHMLQGVVLRNTLGVEGFTYAAAQHVYDPLKKQLTVQCFDRAPINNFADSGLAELGTRFIPLREMAAKHHADGGGLGAVYTFFFLSDPDLYLKLMIWRDEMYRGRLAWESNEAVMEDVFGSLDDLNAKWERWLKARRVTFHHVDWGWEQEGNALKAYGFPWDAQYWSQMDLMYAPAEVAEYDPLRMDYPWEPMPATVGPVKRGVSEPAVGYLADLSGGGWVGMGLGVEGRDMCQVVLAEGKLIVEGKGLPVTRQEFPLSDEVLAAGRADGNRFGVTIRIRQSELQATVRAAMPAQATAGPLPRMQVTVPLDEATRERLVSRHMALVARDGRPKITPHIDDARRPEPDLLQPAPANRWRFPAESELLAVYRAVWRLKDKAPASLLGLRDAMLATVESDPQTQATARLMYEAQAGPIAREVLQAVEGPTAQLAAAELLGISLQAKVASATTAEQASVTARVQSRAGHQASGTVGLSVAPGGALGALPAPQSIEVGAGDSRELGWSWTVPAGRADLATISVDARVTCGGVDLHLTDTLALRPSVPCWWVVGPFDNQGDGTVSTPQAVERAPVDLLAVYAGKDGRELRWRRMQRPAQAKLGDEYVVDLVDACGGDTNVSAYAVAWATSPIEQDALLGIGSDDGVVAWLNGRQVHRNLVSRGYGAIQDRVPVHLRAGPNQLLIKVMQGNGAWAVGAQFLTRDGRPLTGLGYLTG